MRILGISAFFDDSAAALIIGRDIVAAAQEERFSRVKPEGALRCFMGTRIDLMVCGNTVLEESTKDASCIENYQTKYEFD